MGGTSLATGKRHPTLQDRLVVGPVAKILGAISVGAASWIRPDAVVVKAVPPNVVVVDTSQDRSSSEASDTAGGMRPSSSTSQLPAMIVRKLIPLRACLETLEQQVHLATQPQPTHAWGRAEEGEVREPEFVI